MPKNPVPLSVSCPKGSALKALMYLLCHPVYAVWVFPVVHQLFSIGTSFVSMAWSMASYQRLLRVSLKTKHNISWPATIVQFMWHFLVTGRKMEMSRKSLVNLLGCGSFQDSVHQRHCLHLSSAHDPGSGLPLVRHDNLALCHQLREQLL